MEHQSDCRPTLEVCFSPRLFPDILTREPFVVVLVDILRATTSICAAFHHGAKEIIPVATHEAARDYKDKGFLVATEKDGRKLDFADFGNSAFNFTRENIGGHTLVYCTTNGTQALAVAGGSGKVVIAAFINLSAVVRWLLAEHCNTVILCSGWKNKFCLEDSVFAGALSERLLQSGEYSTTCDSVAASVDLWHAASGDVLSYMEKAAHRKRLQRLGLDDILPYSFTHDLTTVIPVFENGIIQDQSQSKLK